MNYYHVSYLVNGYDGVKSGAITFGTNRPFNLYKIVNFLAGRKAHAPSGIVVQGWQKLTDDEVAEMIDGLPPEPIEVEPGYI